MKKLHVITGCLMSASIFNGCSSFFRSGKLNMNKQDPIRSLPSSLYAHVATTGEQKNTGLTQERLEQLVLSLKKLIPRERYKEINNLYDVYRKKSNELAIDTYQKSYSTIERQLSKTKFILESQAHKELVSKLNDSQEGDLSNIYEEYCSTPINDGDRVLECGKLQMEILELMRKRESASTELLEYINESIIPFMRYSVVYKKNLKQEDQPDELNAIDGGKESFTEQLTETIESINRNAVRAIDFAKKFDALEQNFTKNMRKIYGYENLSEDSLVDTLNRLSNQTKNTSFIKVMNNECFQLIAGHLIIESARSIDSNSYEEDKNKKITDLENKFTSQLGLHTKLFKSGMSENEIQKGLKMKVDYLSNERGKDPSYQPSISCSSTEYLISRR